MTDSDLEFKVKRRRWGFLALAVLLGLALLVITNAELAKGLAQGHGGASEVTRQDVGDGASANVFDAASVYTYYFPTMFHNYYVPVWEPLGLSGQNVKSLDIDSTASGVLYAGTFNQGIYKTTDSGNNWYQVNNGLQGDPGVIIGIEVVPSASHFVYVVATRYPYFYFSQNGGQSWQPGGDLGRRPGVVLAPPMTSERVLVGVGALPDVHAGGEIYRSDDGGLSWQMVITDQVLAESMVSSADPSLVYVGGNGLYRSQDGGNSFAPLTVGLPSPFVNVHAVAVHPTALLTAYVSIDEGIYKTTNSGNSWFSWGTETVSELLIDDGDPNTQYAVQSCAGVFVSRDEGKHWQSMGTGLGNLCVNDLAFDQAFARLYAATEDGVWVVNASGESEQ